MAKVQVLNRQTVISDLTLGKDYVKEMKNATSGETCAFWLKKIICNLDTLLERINCENGDRSTTDPVSNKKRKTLPRWNEQVHETGVEGQPDDGYYWRKYGQKVILGATHPRAYYRCTHRDTQGCIATKQVQRKEEVPSVFEVIYRGNHTCVHGRLKQRKRNPDKQQMDITTIKPDVKLEIQEMGIEDQNLPSLAFPTISDEFVQSKNFWEPESFIETSYLPPILSRGTSESFFESDFDGLMLNPTPILDFDYWIRQLNSDSPLVSL